MNTDQDLLTNCRICHKVFETKFEFKFHMRQIHRTRNENTNFVCNICKRQFTRKDSLLRHNGSFHKDIGILPITSKCHFECAKCGFQCNRKDNLKIHLRKCENIDDSIPVFECDVCGIEFLKKIALVRHFKSKHTNVPDPIPPSKIDYGAQFNMRCPLCDDQFSKRKQVIHHIEGVHNIEIKPQYFTFPTIEKFYEWKQEIEELSITFYRKSSRQEKSNYIVQVFLCHRSGSYRPKESGRKRRLKLCGTKRINRLCPAQIFLHVNKMKGICTVEFIDVHLGHPVNDRTELVHMYGRNNHFKTVDSNEKSGTIFKMHDGTWDTFDIEGEVSDISKMVLDEAWDPLMSDRIISEEFVTSNIDSVLYYKSVGILDAEYKFLNRNDMIIVCMDEFQASMLIKHACRIVAFVGMRNELEFGYILHTLSVLNDFDEGFVVAFALSNRFDDKIIEMFIDRVANRVGQLNHTTIVTDLNDDYYEKWSTIMGEPKYHWYCLWHVREEWRKNLDLRMTSRLKRNMIRKKLQAVMTQLDEKEFKKKLNEFIESDDAETQNFVEYFQNTFSHCANRWAYCYRYFGGENMDLNMGTFNKKLQTLQNDFDKITTLPLCFEFLTKHMMGYDNNTACRAIKSKSCFKLRALRQRHDQLIKEKIEMSIENADGGWYVFASTVQNEKNEVVFVKPSCNECPGCRLYCEKCEECLHKYACSCVDCAIRGNMCLHIHGVCLFLKKDNTENIEMTIIADDIQASGDTDVKVNCDGGNYLNEAILQTDITDDDELITILSDSKEKVKPKLEGIGKMKTEISIVEEVRVFVEDDFPYSRIFEEVEIQ